MPIGTVTPLPDRQKRWGLVWYRVEQDRLVVGDSLRHESVPVGIADHAVEVRLSGVDAGRQLLIHNHLRGLSFPSAIGNP